MPNILKIKKTYNLSSSHIESHKRGIWYSKSSMNNRFKKIVLELKDFKFMTVLDIGCGDASLFKYLNYKRSAIDYHGIDISDKIINIAKKNNHKIKKNLKCLDIKKFSTKKKFDLIVCIGLIQYTNISFEDLLSEIKKRMFSYSKIIIDGKLNKKSSDNEILTENYIKKIIKKKKLILENFIFHNADKCEFSKTKKFNNFMIFLKNDN